MRYGVLADIHGNLHALRAVLQQVDRTGVDGYLCLGDLVGYGPFPNECVEVVAELGAVCVAGNHDLIALERLAWDQCIPLARESLAWTRKVLRADARDYLSGLPLRAAVGGEVVMAHGSLDNPREYVVREEQAEAQLCQLAEEHQGARLLLLGHTHRQSCWVTGSAERTRIEIRGEASVSLGRGPESSEARHLANPGSVGQSRERHAEARFMVLDLERGAITFHSAGYPVELCRRALRERGLPAHSCHLRPSPLRAAAGRVRRLAKRLTASKK